MRTLSRLLFAVILAVALAGAAIGLMLAGKATTLAVLVVVFAFIGLALFRDLEWLAFIFVSASLPIRLNMRLSEPADYFRAHSAVGFPVSLTDCLIIVLVLSWLRRILFYDQPIRWVPQITVPMVFLFGWVVWGAARAEADSIAATWMVLKYLQCCALLLYLINNIKPLRDYVMHSLAVSGVLVFESLLGFGQAATGGFNFGMEILGAPMKRSVERTGSRIVGTLPTPNVFAAILAAYLIHPIGLLFSRNRLNKILIFGVVFATGLATLGTKSRGVWLSSTLVFGYMIFAVLRTRFSMFRSVFGLFWIITLLGILAFSTPGVIDRLTEDDRGSAEARPLMNQIAWNMIEARPLVGFGWDNYTLHFESYDDTEIKHSVEFPFIVHNGYLYTAAEYGMPALLLLMWIYFWVLKNTLHFLPREFTFPAVMAFLFPWAVVARLIQMPLYVNQPIIEVVGYYLLGMSLAFKELAAQDEERRRRGLPDPLLVD
jgi:O-antigen ligase